MTDIPNDVQKTVPLAPTRTMRIAGHRCSANDGTYIEIYTAMLAAAPDDISQPKTPEECRQLARYYLKRAEFLHACALFAPDDVK